MAGRLRVSLVNMVSGVSQSARELGNLLRGGLIYPPLCPHVPLFNVNSMQDLPLLRTTMVAISRSCTAIGLCVLDGASLAGLALRDL